MLLTRLLSHHCHQILLFTASADLRPPATTSEKYLVADDNKVALPLLPRPPGLGLAAIRSFERLPLPYASIPIT